MAELGICKPILWKLTVAIGHVSAAENAEFQHLLGRHFRRKGRIKAHSYRLGKVVDVILLHEIIDDDFTLLHHVPPIFMSGFHVECSVCHGSRASARPKLKMIPDCADFLDRPFEHDNEYAYEYGTHATNPCAPLVLSDP